MIINKKIIIFSVLVIIIAIAISLIPISWVSASDAAVKKANRNTLIRASEIIKSNHLLQNKDMTEKEKKEILKKCLSELYEISSDRERVPLRICPIINHNYIAVIMTTLDSEGMLWAITFEGDIIKIYPPSR